MIPFILSLPIGVAVAWIGFLAIKNIERRVLWAKWVTLQNRGTLYPFFWRWMQKRKKIALMKRELPFLIDLLSIAVRAGMDLLQAVEKIVQTLPPSPLLSEFAKMLEDLKLGRTRREALQSFKARVPLPDIRVLVSLLLQAIQLGTPLSSILLATARQMRERRFSRAERLGSQSAVKILFPLVFCLMPSLFLLVFAPLVLKLMTGGMEGLLW